MISEISITLGSPATTFDISTDANKASMTITVSQKGREEKGKSATTSTVKLTAFEASALEDAITLLTDASNT